MGVGGPSGSGTEEAGWLAEAHRTSGERSGDKPSGVGGQLEDRIKAQVKELSRVFGAPQAWEDPFLLSVGLLTWNTHTIDVGAELERKGVPGRAGRDIKTPWRDFRARLGFTSSPSCSIT